MITRLIERYNRWCYEPTQDYILHLRLMGFAQNAKRAVGDFMETGLFNFRWVA